MAFSLVQAGTSLQLLKEDGTAVTLTLPTGIALRTDVLPRWAIFGNYVVLVNTPDQPLTIDQTGVVRLLCPRAPRTAPLLSGATTGTLSGTYKARHTFVEFDSDGRLIYETDYSVTSNTVAIASKKLRAAQLDTLPNSTTNGRRVYRTSTATSVFFEWLTVDGNTATSAEDDTSDAGISTLGAPARGTPPYLTHIAEFRNRLFGVSADDVDTLRYTEVAEMFAWAGDNTFAIPRVGSDNRGITALMPRRDALGIGRQNVILQLTGTDDTNFNIIKLSENAGVASQETVAIYQDIAYFLWYDGVYSWGPDGIVSLSNSKVRSWFTKDDTFNRSLFDQAFAIFDPNRKRYLLFLASAGSTAVDTWVEYDFASQTWWGPHVSSKYTPTSTFTLYTTGNVPQLAIGTQGADVVQEQDTRTDGTTDAISTSATLAPLFGESADLNTYFGELSVLTKAHTGGTLTVTPSVGEPGSFVTGKSVAVRLDQDRKRVGRIGVGRACTLAFTHDTRAETVELGGLEIPMSTVGRR